VIRQAIRSRPQEPAAATASRSSYGTRSPEEQSPVTRRRNGSAVVAEGRPADQQ